VAHGHICAGQILGLRMTIRGMDLTFCDLNAGRAVRVVAPAMEELFGHQWGAGGDGARGVSGLQRGATDLCGVRRGD
jgi:hypothetical protein